MPAAVTLVLRNCSQSSFVSTFKWNKPGGFWKRGERLSVQFPHKREGNGFFDLQVKANKKELVITQLLQAIP